ncbi:MAG TPA: SprT-like domain-containing protein [Candidatus Thermoplasmatota archaeon]|jgi:predicted SprT family Zn-dependent metalloprotease|nr:SprT-like domain-containing protein [Candidatus Thermoplasmatota archaeon]
MEALLALEEVLRKRWNDVARELPGRTPAHDLRFSGRVTNAWALIYFRRKAVRFSPYLFLLEPQRLHHRNYWRELDATLKHEVVHAHLYAAANETSHTERFHDLLEGLGVRANGDHDLGPENATFRYVYRCVTCRAAWRRRVPLRGSWSCGRCQPGRYHRDFAMKLEEVLPSPLERLAGRERVIWATVDAASRHI